MLDKLNRIKDALDSIEDFVRDEVDVIGAELKAKEDFLSDKLNTKSAHLVEDYGDACPHGYIKVDGVCQPIK